MTFQYGPPQETVLVKTKTRSGLNINSYTDTALVYNLRWLVIFHLWHSIAATLIMLRLNFLTSKHWQVEDKLKLSKLQMETILRSRNVQSGQRYLIFDFLRLKS